MNDPIENRLREASWRRPLTAGEQAELRAWLAAHPEAKADWEVESRLNEALGSLPEAPVATNFTARVLQAIERDAASGARRPGTKWQRLWRSFLPRAAAAAVIVGAGVFSYRESLAAKRVRLARSVAAVSEVTSLPGPEVLQDFEAIRQLNSTPRPDPDLLALLK